MAQQAKYILYIPTTDELGQPLKDLSPAVEQALAEITAPGLAYTDPGKRHAGDVYTHFTAFADDTPESDSTFKQVAVYLAQVANLQSLPVTKESKQGPQQWTMTNAQYVPGLGADQSAIDQSVGSPPLMPQEARTASLIDYLTHGPSAA